MDPNVFRRLVAAGGRRSGAAITATWETMRGGEAASARVGSCSVQRGAWAGAFSDVLSTRAAVKEAASGDAP
jgi:hypothetical protein